MERFGILVKMDTIKVTLESKSKSMGSRAREIKKNNLKKHLYYGKQKREK